MPKALSPVSSAARVAVLAMVLSTATIARAAPGEAQERFEEGRALLKAGRPADAIPKFVASIASEPTIAALLNLADCYERIGKLASAHARFRQAQDLAKEKDPVRSDEARKRAEILEPRLSTITLLPPPQSEGVRVWIDGIEVTSKEWGKPRPYDAGPHEIISQSARGTRKKTITTLGADAARVTAPIEVDPAPDKPEETRGSGPPPPPRKEDSGSGRTIGIVTGGVGLAVLATGVVTGIIALGASSDLKDSCPSYPQCPSNQRGELVDLDDRARTFGTVSTVTVIAGSALVVIGAVFFLTAPSRSSSSSASGSRWSRGWQVATW